jgi:hypothetical protein
MADRIWTTRDRVNGCDSSGSRIQIEFTTE